MIFKKCDKYGYPIKNFNYLGDRFLRFFSIPIARILSKTNVRPEGVAITSLILAIFASILYSMGSRSHVFYASLIFFISWITDCVDGDLARLTSKVSCFGDWLDSTVGKVSIVFIFLGICHGLAKYNGPSVWILGFFIISGLYISAITTFKVKLIEANRDSSSTKDSNDQNELEKRSLLRTIIRELTVGYNCLYYIVILAGLFNRLYEGMILSVIYFGMFTVLTIFYSYRKVRKL